MCLSLTWIVCSYAQLTVRAWCLQRNGHCMFAPHQLQRQGGPVALGFKNWHEMWLNYTVFTTVRNPYNRAASSYDYMEAERKVTSCHDWQT